MRIASNVARWIVSTSLLTGLMVGLALILFLLASVLSEFLNRRYHLDDDWSLLALPVGALVGLVLGIRYRKRGWLRFLAGALLVLSIGLIVSWSIPRQAPESIPEGMNRLPIALATFSARRCNALH